MRVLLQLMHSMDTPPLHQSDQHACMLLQVLMSDVYCVAKRPAFFGREWNSTDLAYAAFLGGMHLVACLAPFTFRCACDKCLFCAH